MTTTLSETQARLLRTKGQRLAHDAAAGDATSVVKHMVVIQAQLLQAALLGIRARSKGLTVEDVRRALWEDHTLTLTWGPRGTLHLIAAEDVKWLLGLLGPRIISSFQGRYRQLNLDEEIMGRAVPVIAQAAKRGSVTRAEIAQELKKGGVKVDLTGQALPYLINRAALEGAICLGPPCGSKATYIRLGKWAQAPGNRSRRDWLAELFRRYIAAYGPATREDFATWSGLGIKDARDAWEMLRGEISEVRIDSQTAWVSAGIPLRSRGSGPAKRTLRLLPGFDAYLLGYRDRNLVLEAAYAKRVNTGGGMIYPSLLVDGRITGTWKTEFRGEGVTVRVMPFRTLPAGRIAELEREAEDVGSFLGKQAELIVGSI